MDPEAEGKMARQYAFFLERHSYKEVFAFVDNLHKQPDKYWYFYKNLQDLHIFTIISNHKIALAKILIQAAGVSTLDEDRSRIVFLLAKFYNSNPKAANQAFATEFGANFKILETYQIGKIQKSWKELAIRAKEIHNGYRNFDFLNARFLIRDIFAFYKIFEVKDRNTLLRLSQLASQILAVTADLPIIYPENPRYGNLKTLVLEFYKLANRLPIDAEVLEEALDFEQINEFVFQVKTAADVRLFLMERKLPPDNFEQAELALLETYSTMFSDNYMGDDLKRLHVKLEPARING